MKISQFCLRLKSFFTCSFLYSDPDTEIYSFKPLNGDKSLLRDILYIVPDSLSPDTGSSATVNLLMYSQDDGAISEVREHFPHGNIICVKNQSGDSIASLFDIVSDIFLQENRFASQLNHMSHVSSTNRGMQALIDEASRMLDAPIIVIDTSYRLMVMSTGNIESDDAQLEEQRNIGTLTEQNLMRMRRDRIFEYIRKKPDRMLYCIAPDSNHWWMNMLVYVHGIEVAEIGIMENSRKFTEYDIELMKHLRYLLSLEIQRGHAFGANFGVAHGLLVTELLEQKFTTLEVINRRARLLGWQTAPSYMLMTVFQRSRHSDMPKHFYRQSEILSSQISRIFHKAYWRIGDTDVVYIIPVTDKIAKTETWEQRLREMLKSNQALAIIANPVPSLMDIRRAYEQTRALFKLREFFVDDSPLYRYSDNFILHIAGILNETHMLSDFYHPYIVKLIEYDRENKTEFVRTLREYLTYIDNPAVIASHLHIHKNTLYYRINKLKELFPIDLNDGKMRLRLQLTLEMMRIDRANHE